MNKLRPKEELLEHLHSVHEYLQNKQAEYEEAIVTLEECTCRNLKPQALAQWFILVRERYNY